jgi:hypothetical protein
LSPPHRKVRALIRFVGQLDAVLGKRDDGVSSFAAVRNLLYREAIGGDPIAQSELPAVLKIPLTDDDFRSFVGELEPLLDQPFAVLAMTAIVGFHVCPDRAIAERLLTRGIEMLPSASSAICRMLDGLCSRSLLSLPAAQTNALFECYRTNIGLSGSLLSIVDGGFVDLDRLINFISDLDSTLYNEAVVHMVRSILFRKNLVHPPISIPRIPFEAEDFLWRLCLNDSEQQANLGSLLVSFYASNDGVVLTDHAMIATFLNKWSVMFAGSDRMTALLRILRTFISDTERLVDLGLFSVKRHRPQPEQAMRTIRVSGKSLISELVFVVPEDLQVGVLRQRISRIAVLPVNGFIIAKGSDLITDATPVKQIVPQGQTSAQLSIVKKNRADDRRSMQHSRSSIPSVFIVQSGSHIFELLIRLLEDDDANSLAKEILDYLPTDPLTELQIEEISRRRNFDYSKFFPVQSPKLFQYNFEALSASFNSANFERTGGCLYLIKSIPKCPSMALSLIAFLDKFLSSEMRISLASVIWETLFPCLASLRGEEFRVVATFLQQFDPIELPQDVVEAAMESLLLSEAFAIRSLSAPLFKKLPVPMEFFVKKIQSISKNAEFYMALVDHVDKASPELIGEI